MSTGIVSSSKLHRRRSSLPNIKLVPLTMAERRLMARQKRKDEEEAAALAKQQEAEERKQRMKQLRENAKARDKEKRSKYTVRDGKVLCSFCGELIDSADFDEHWVTHPTQIRDRIWLGNAPNSADVSFMRKYGITHILNCTREIKLSEEVSKLLSPNDGFMRVAIADKNCETILDYVVESNLWFEKALGSDPSHKVFVHCREGRSRSVSFLCAFLMWKERLSFISALADIRSKRYIVLPNNKFYAELEVLDKEIVIDRESQYTRFKKPDDSVKLRKIKAAKSSSKRPKANGVIGRPIGKEVSGDDEKQLVDEVGPIVDATSTGRERSNSTPMSPKAEVAKSSKKRKEKKKKKKKKKDGKDVDLKVEEAVDVTDIFPTQTKKKKKKKRKKTSD